MNKQRGGTVLGLMIGVVLGLAAALVVAVFVTKTPSPFNNKMQNHSVETDATESKKNKGWDPNAVLAGKNPAKPTPPVLPATVTGAPNTLITTPITVPITTPITTQATASKPPNSMPTAVIPIATGSLNTSVTTGTASAPKTSTTLVQKPSVPDPINDLMKSKAEPKLSNSPSDLFMYFVQVGAFRTPEDAEAQRARLSLQGIDAKVTEREQAGRTVYRVRSGPFNKEEDADRVKDKLSATGVDAALVRVQR